MFATDAVRHLMNSQGRTLRIRYYTNAVGSVWDDDNTWTQSGTDLYISGLFQSLRLDKGSDDATLLEQGRIVDTDKVFFVAGSIETTSGLRVSTFTVSGVNQVFREINPGVFMPSINADDIYKKYYGRIIDTGSLF